MFFRIKTNELVRWKAQRTRKPLVLQGARQVGKTFLLQEFGRSHFANVHYFNFEEDKALASIFAPNFKVPRILDDLSLYQNKEIGLDDLIIFDEIQAAPSALTSLKYFCETRP